MNRAGEPRRITSMLRRTLLALAIGSVLFMTASAAFADDPVLLTPLDFDGTTGVLTASLGFPPPAFFLNTPATVHLTSVLHFLPPNPCDGLVRAWDVNVMHQSSGKDVQPVFVALLTLLATHQCTLSASVAANVDGTFTLLSIGPGN
jgi:hypothetical protein